MSYEIEEGVVMPRAMRGNITTKYPWKEMLVDQSFFVPQTATKNIYASIVHANKRYAPRKYAGRAAEKDGIRGTRIWRVA